MGYRIIYLPERKRKRIWPWILAMLAVSAFCVYLIPKGRQAVETLLVPGELETTKQAFAQLVQELKAGEQALPALTQFCREVMAGIR